MRGAPGACTCSAYTCDMQNSARNVTTPFENALTWAITLAALALLGAVLAYWTWMWLAPPSEPRLSTPATFARSEPAYALFGGAAAEARSGTVLTLLGIAASTGAGQARAIVRLDGRSTRVVGTGEQVAPGVRISEISAPHVVLDHGGAAEKLELPRRPVAPAQAPQARHQ